MELVKREVELCLNDTEEENITLAQEGNIKAFESLISAYESHIYNFTYNVFNNVLDAQDVTQEIFVKAFKNIKKYYGEITFKEWLYKISIIVCRSEITKNKFRIFEIIDNDESENKIGYMKQYKEIIKKIKFKYKIPLILRDFQGLTYAEISNVLEEKDEKVKKYVDKARKIVKNKFLNNNPSVSFATPTKPESDSEIKNSTKSCKIDKIEDFKHDEKSNEPENVKKQQKIDKSGTVNEKGKNENKCEENK